MKLKLLLSTFALISLGACSTLPSSGPTGSQITDTALEAQVDGASIDIVPVDSIADVPPVAAPIAWQLPDYDPPPSDMIGPGDVLSVTVFEAGVALFGGNGASAGLAGGFDPAVRAQTLPPRRVDDNGMIDIPYVGAIQVAGSTAADVQAKIRNGLRSLSQDPQVLVSREQVIGNSIIIAGEVAQPGRLVLQTNRETMSDVVALAGGYRGEAKNLTLLIERGDDLARLRLSDVLAGTYESIRAYPGDRLTILAEPMLYSVLGASGRVQQIPFVREHMNVIEAIAAAGGPDGNTGDPEAVFLFRYTGPDKTQPTVYHFNLMRAPTFFLAQRFALRDDDILYFGNSESNQPRKLIQTIGQLFSPIVTATAVANNINSGN
ncbi:polysaccharide biosynthesis/export family protein [Qipengyuania qiaonensis]|uniref:Polysaccharide export protein n=1 Tax=Qipengyuania qiaonensis TaxID=2867240 RepID=A0ABS7J3U7_9SPHN|nr:polysaccharide biosynthesis/export family protein [Qipengyuania qiaonensis]MBX7482000.1 polysaccharide export protein [Qipengyuania qiaonensis]